MLFLTGEKARGTGSGHDCPWICAGWNWDGLACLERLWDQVSRLHFPPFTERLPLQIVDIAHSCRLVVRLSCSPIPLV